VEEFGGELELRRAGGKGGDYIPKCIAAVRLSNAKDVGQQYQSESAVVILASSQADNQVVCRYVLPHSHGPS
jgi:hypothetical protein